MPKTTRVSHQIWKSAVLRLVTVNDEVATDEYSDQVEQSLQPPDNQTGEIVQLNLYSTSPNPAGNSPAGWLLIFDADPGLTAGDTELTAEANEAIISAISVAATDWRHEYSCGSASLCLCAPVYFDPRNMLYAAWKHTDARDLNAQPWHNNTLSVIGHAILTQVYD